MAKHIELMFTSATYSVEYVGPSGEEMLGFAYLKFDTKDNADTIAIDLDSVSIDNPAIKDQIERVFRMENQTHGKRILKIPREFFVEWLGKLITFELKEVGYGVKIGSLVIAETRGMFDDIRTWSIKKSGD